MQERADTALLRDRISELEKRIASGADWATVALQIDGVMVQAHRRLVREQRAMIESVKAGTFDWAWLASQSHLRELVQIIEELSASCGW